MPFYYGEMGVSIFFVLSGFIITHLLIRGAESTSYLSLTDFYLRRAFRILPPLLVYLAVILILVLSHTLKLLPIEIFAALFFFRDYVYPTNATGPWVSHLWSLSVEEQFYLAWPPAMAFLNRKSALLFGLFVICAEPVVRVLTYFYSPAWRGLMGSMFHTRADSLAIGCVAALLWSSRYTNRISRILSTPLAATLALFTLLVISPLLFFFFGGKYTLLFGFTTDGFCTAFVILSTTLYPGTWLGKLLNIPVVSWLGRASYSIYLWQQMFLTPSAKLIGGSLIWNLNYAPMLLAG